MSPAGDIVSLKPYKFVTQVNSFQTIPHAPSESKITQEVTGSQIMDWIQVARIRVL
jgi:hypothetical protein